MDTTGTITKKTAKGDKTVDSFATGMNNNVKIMALRPIRAKPGKGLYTKGDTLIVPYGEAEALIAAGAAAMA